MMRSGTRSSQEVDCRSPRYRRRDRRSDTLNVFDIENNLIGFQGGVKYDVWNWGRRFSLQGFLNSGVYYNKAKYSNLLQEAENGLDGVGTSRRASTRT